MVIGNPANVEQMPGSAHVITKADIRQQSYDDINRVLRKVPGVNVREEDGFGLFPNISLRGVDTTRSAKVTIMEDGVLMAPAPYSAPSAYYSPTVGRMSGLEVLKGSSQIKYGPHITGGVINYLSTPIPLKEAVYLKMQLGNFNEQRTHAYIGNTVDTVAGQVGFLVEGYFRQNQGFKTIDETADFQTGDDTGFIKSEPMIKLSWEPDSDIYQRLELKWGATKLDANETYLGLSEADFKTEPSRRYTASRFDNIDSEQTRSHLRYTVGPTDNLDVITTLYNTSFERNWYKLKDLRNVNGNTIGLSAALAGAQNSEGLDCLKGDLACTLRIRANNREYYANGIETVAYYRFGSDSVQHEVSTGIRYHQDQVRRFQWDDDYTQEANGTISGVTPGTPGDAGDRLQKTKALALFVQDTIETGPWSITPGIRFEKLDQHYETPKGTTIGDNKMNMTAGGLGIAYQFNESWTGFGGIHRGFSPPSPNGAVTKNLKEESNIAIEAGLRYSNANQALAADATFFYTQFKDLLVIDNIGGVGNGVDGNFGEVDSYGLEFSSQFDAGIANQWTLRNPWFLTLTYTNAEQQNDARSDDAESIFSFGKKGNKLPYIPEWVINLGTGIESKHAGAFIAANYVDDAFTSADNTSEQINGNGDPDARFGKSDNYFITDISAFYKVTEKVKVFGGVQNLLNEEYIVSRQPHGPRPGLPRFAYVGLEMTL
ncbi:MAG: TonB-dependent receptor [Gammaproteobacteria bacterium]|nr:TonB-dependent receptor [Gammaproteobacteria bacterium]